MTSFQTPSEPSEADRRRMRKRNLVTLAVLSGFVLSVFFLALFHVANEAVPRM